MANQTAAFKGQIGTMVNSDLVSVDCEGVDFPVGAVAELFPTSLTISGITVTNGLHNDKYSGTEFARVLTQGQVWLYVGDAVARGDKVMVLTADKSTFKKAAVGAVTHHVLENSFVVKGNGGAAGLALVQLTGLSVSLQKAS